MINKIEQWIDQTNSTHKEQRISCDSFTDAFNGFYSISYLKDAYFVVVDEIPKPDMPELQQLGLQDFFNMDIDGITYKNTYYIRPHVRDNLRLNFHELVHVAQWSKLGATQFIQRYINEIQTFGYADAPLEKMAYALDTHYSSGGEIVDVVDYVSEKV